MKKQALVALLLLGACDQMKTLTSKDPAPAPAPAPTANAGQPPASGATTPAPAKDPGTAAQAPASGATPPSSSPAGAATPGGAEAVASGLPAGFPAANGAALLEYVTKTSPYTAWKTLPKKLYPESIATEAVRPNSIRFFNGLIARVYYNELGQAALARGEKQMPPGTIIVVERWAQKSDGSVGPEESPDNLVAMYKVPGSDPENGDWFYLVSANGAVKTEGGPAAKACQACHALVKDNDFRFTDSGKLDFLKPTAPDLSDGGVTFATQLLGAQPGGLHYTHYSHFPEATLGEAIPRSKTFNPGIEWFNGKFDARLFANAVAQASLAAGKGQTFPFGSILVAEQFEKTPDGVVNPNPFAIVVQFKAEGADPQHGDWVWLSYSFKENKVLTFGKDAKFCYDCHDQVKDNDFVWSTSGKAPKKKGK
jgi:hypothetical protein